MAVSRNVNFNEDEKWNLNNTQNGDNSTGEKPADQWKEELEDDPPVRGTRSLSEIYASCNVAICEPAAMKKH